MKNTPTPTIGSRVRHAVVLSTAGLAAFCAASLFAQSSGSSTYDSRNSSSSSTGGTSSTSSDHSHPASSVSGSYNGSAATDVNATNPNMVGGNDTSTMLTRGDRRFVTKASELNKEEVRLSELAAQQASSPEVRNYAQQLVNEHTQAGTELSAIASRKGVTATAHDDYDQRAVNKLAKKTGKDFDEAYVEKMKDAHEDAIDLFEKEAKNAKDPDLQAFASKTLPTLREHQQHAKMLEKAVK
jgi:putative membrane protein